MHAILNHLAPEEWKKLLVARHLLSADEFDRLWAEARHHEQSFSELLLDRGIFSTSELWHICADYFQIPLLDLSTVAIDPEALREIPEIVARQYSVIAFKKDAKGLHVAISNPHDATTLDQLKKKLDQPMVLYLASEEAILQIVENYVHSHLPKIKEYINQFAAASTPEANASLVSDLVRELVVYALRNRAADIHLEPLAHRFIVRYRIDGILHHIIDMPSSLGQQCIESLASLAGIKSHGESQVANGKIKFDFSDGPLDLRISLAPVVAGQKAVVRLMGHRHRNLNLPDLGLQSQQLRSVETVISHSQGMIITCGPVGSGRTSTLYAILKKKNSEQVNISTIEDPVEYDIEGINQIQVQESIGLTYLEGLNVILRQDSDVIMISALKDVATAQAALSAAINGHLVLASMDAPRSADVITRFLEMDIEPYAISVGLSLVICQRLVRRLCQHCRQEYTIGLPEREIIAHQLHLDAKIIPSRLYKEVGCTYCGQTGFRDRVGIYEVLEIKDTIKEAILKKNNASDIEQKAIGHGMVSLGMDAMSKVSAGLTTINEVVSELAG